MSLGRNSSQLVEASSQFRLSQYEVDICIKGRTRGKTQICLQIPGGMLETVGTVCPWYPIICGVNAFVAVTDDGC